MNRLQYIIFILFFLFSSCAKQKPKNILSEDKMVELMTEVSLIDAYLNTLPVDSGKMVMPIMYEKAYSAFELDSSTFTQNLNFYLSNPNLTEKVYTEVGKSLTKLDREYSVKDSIASALYQDSVRRIERIRFRSDFYRNIIFSGQQDSIKYTYQDHAQNFYNVNFLGLNLSVYGVQIPLQAQENIQPAAVQTNEATPDTNLVSPENRPTIGQPQEVPQEVHVEELQQLRPVEESKMVKPVRRKLDQ